MSGKAKNMHAARMSRNGQMVTPSEKALKTQLDETLKVKSPSVNKSKEKEKDKEKDKAVPAKSPKPEALKEAPKLPNGESKSKESVSKDKDKDKDTSKDKSTTKSKDDSKAAKAKTKDGGTTSTLSVTKDAPASKEDAPKKAAAAAPNLEKLIEIAEAKAAEARKKMNLKEFIKRHLLEGSRRMDYDLDQVHAVLDLAKEAFLKSSPLLELSAPVNICGDIHGQYGDLFRIFNACGLPFRKCVVAAPLTSFRKYLFLGDYVDRGRHSLEVILLLLALRIEFPSRVYLLRGNHELANINKVYGFLAECRQRFRAGNDHKVLYDHFNEVFAVMPLAAIVSNKILCMHGGLSPFLNSLDDIRKLTRPIVVARGLAQDLLWADPDNTVHGFQTNKIRAVSHVFGEDAVAAKCKQLNIDLVIRAHQVVEFGYAFFASRMLITVFSAARYHEDLWNFAAVVRVDEKLEISFTQLKPTEFEQYRRDKQAQAAATADNQEDDDDQK